MKYIIQKQFYYGLWHDERGYDSIFDAAIGFQYAALRLEVDERIRLARVEDDAEGGEGQ